MQKKGIILFTLILTLSMSTLGLSQNVSKKSKQKFKVCMSSIKASQNHQIRYNNATEYFLNEWSTTLQLQDVCYYLPNDELKYQLCMAAYPNIIDKSNFFNIYDSFSKFSYAIKLYHNTQSKDNSLESLENDNTTTHEQSEIDCFIDEERFSHIYKIIEDETFTNKQKIAAQKYIAKKCFSMSQLKRIVSILMMDNDKLELIKYLYHYAPIPDKVYTFKSELTFKSNKDKLEQFLLDQGE